MYITLDYKCLSCGYEAERFVKKVDQDKQICGCDKPMRKQLGATKTHFRFADTKLKK